MTDDSWSPWGFDAPRVKLTPEVTRAMEKDRARRRGEGRARSKFGAYSKRRIKREGHRAVREWMRANPP